MIDDLLTVFSAEFMRRIRSRPYIIGLIIGIIGILLFTRLPALVGDAFGGSSSIVVVGSPALTARAIPLLKSDYDVKAELQPQPITEPTLKEYDAAAAFVLTSTKSGLDVNVYAHDPGSMGVRQVRRALMPLQLALTTGKSSSQVKNITNFPVDVKPVASKFSSADQAELVRGIAYTLIFFLYILILVNSQLVTSSVAEEKTSRIAELLVASVDPVALLGGKILAGAVLALVQLCIWIAAATLGGHGSPPPHGSDSDNVFSLANLFDVLTPGVVVAFFIFFLIGFLQVSTIFAAMASLINRTEDLGSVTGPLAIPVVAALFIAIGALGTPDAPWAVVTSFVPIIAPFIMFARIAVSYVPFWQIGLSLLVNLAALYLIAVFAGKIYRVGMLLYGRAPKLSQVWSVIRS
ncbi:MAG: ABC transporter permease [Candidatus Eremiobacteraeota bacterium]|nr:ABC transporter permease [Candidatus Eremiobacteraeota bacterium]